MKKLLSVVLILATLVSMLAVSSVTTAAATTDGLPDKIDNSQSKYFPQIMSQGDQGSCVAWAQAYYQFSYEMNRALDRESTKENCFSPSFVYNMSNYGEDSGCFPVTAYNNMKRIGVAPLSTIPYNKEDHLNWFAEESIWQEAAKYRIADFKVLPDFRIGSGKHVEHPDDPDLTQIKTLLSEGHVLAFGAYINRWKTSTIKSNPACPENDAYVGEDVVTATSPDIGNGYGHRMTLVGYNDNIWVDINGNNSVDSGEMGAFKVANSYNTWWKNDGFIWIAYDNINMTTSVAGGLPYKTMSGIVEVTKITVLPYNSDADIYVRYTLNTSDRHDVYVTVSAEKDGETFEVAAGPYHQAPYLNNHYSFDGTTNANDGTMIFMLSNVVPGITSETMGDYKWSIKFEDRKADSKALTVKNVEIVDNATGRIAKVNEALGFALDNSSKTLTFSDIAPYIPQTSTAAPTTTAAETTTATPTTTEAVTITEATKTEPAETTTSQAITVTDTTTDATTTPTTETTPTTAVTDPTEITTETPAVSTIPTITTEAITTTTAAVTTTKTKTTHTTTQAPATSTCPTEVSTHIYGDTNSSDNISISDASLIQKFVAFIIGSDKINLNNADCNNDGKVSVKDATCIQKYLAKLSGYGRVGEKYTVSIPVTITTEATEETTGTTGTISTTEAVTTTKQTEVAVTDPSESVAPTETKATDPTEVITTSVSTTAEITTEPETTAYITTVTTEVTDATEVITTTTAVTEPITETPSEIITEPITTEPATTEVVDPVENNVVTFTNSFGWQGTISCYYWSDSNKTMTTWPGVKMENAGTNSFGETLYTLQIPKEATYVIFSNGSIQTVDIPYSGGEQKFYPVAPNGEGKYTVEIW